MVGGGWDGRGYGDLGGWLVECEDDDVGERDGWWEEGGEGEDGWENGDGGKEVV